MSIQFVAKIFTYATLCDNMENGGGIMAKLSDMLVYFRKRKDLSQEALAKELGLTRSSISMYELGKREPPLEVLELIADYYNVDMNTLLGKDSSQAVLPSNVIPLPNTYSVPLLGTIACGDPILAEQNIIDKVSVPETVKGADFALLCNGDSMINARIFDGDIVYIHMHDTVDNGSIAAVLIGDEATLKKVYYTPGSDRITLRPCNPLYPDYEYAGEDLNKIRILGKAIAFTSAVR